MSSQYGSLDDQDDFSVQVLRTDLTTEADKNGNYWLIKKTKRGDGDWIVDSRERLSTRTAELLTQLSANGVDAVQLWDQQRARWQLT